MENHTPPTQAELEWKKHMLLLMKEIDKLRVRNDFLERFTPKTNLDLIDDLARLTKEVEELRKDKERLDDLIALAKQTQVTISYSFNDYVDIQLQSGQCFSSFTDLRLALDSTRSAMQQKGEE